MKHYIHRPVVVLCSLFILFLSTQPGNTQIPHRWDFNFGKEGWLAEGTSYDEVGTIIPFSFFAENGEMKTYTVPANLTIRNLYFKYSPKYITELKDLTIRLTLTHSFFCQALVMSSAGNIVESNTIHKNPIDEYQEITLAFDNPISNPKIIRICFEVKNELKYFRMNVDWIEANTVKANNYFDLTFDPPGNVIQKGEQGEFNVQADWGGNQNLLVAQKQPIQLLQNNFNLVEDSPHGELLDLIVGETTAQAKFLFTAQELGSHLVNFMATLENLPGNPLEITKQLPIYVTDFDPNTLFSETSSAENWMLYKN